MASSASWWAAKVRQFRAHVGARVSPIERATLASWTAPEQRRLFASMPVADQRHGLDVVASLRAAGVTDREVLLAGLLHDAGKGRAVRLTHRIAWSLGERYGAWVWSTARLLPGFRRAEERIRRHAQTSALLAVRAGCTERTAALIRHQDAPIDELGRLLLAADEAS